MPMHKRDGSPVRRGLQLVVLLTGLAAHGRGERFGWEQSGVTNKTAASEGVEPKPTAMDRHRATAATCSVRSPKGGKERAFTIPLRLGVREVLTRRRDDNINDQGWAFPTGRAQDRACHLCAGWGNRRTPSTGECISPSRRRTPRSSRLAASGCRDTYTTALAQLDPRFAIRDRRPTTTGPPRGSVHGRATSAKLDLAGAQEQ